MLRLAPLLITLTVVVGVVLLLQLTKTPSSLGLLLTLHLESFQRVFRHYYNNPTATTAQRQPVVTDPILVRVFVD